MLDDAEDRDPAKLSGTQRSRLNLAAAITRHQLDTVRELEAYWEQQTGLPFLDVERAAVIQALATNYLAEIQRRK